jgi:quercetin dioxygenase-like cupin family protein
MKLARIPFVGMLLVVASLCLAAAADSDFGFVRIAPEQIVFKGTPAFSQAILFGDPTKPGIYVVRVKFGPGVHTNPHTHSQDRHVTVIKGLWWMGVGDKADVSKAIPMKVGSYALHPAGAAHWDGAGDEETIVQIMGLGPVDTVPLDPKAERTSIWHTPKVTN